MPRETTSHAQWLRESLERYEQPLVRYARRMTGDLELARDIVQDTFLKLVSAERESVDGHLAEWLFTVCRNRCLDVRRKERRMTTMPENDGGAARVAETPAAAPGEASARDHEVLDLFGALPERQQEVIRLKFIGGLSYKEISRVTDLTVSNVGFLIHTGLKSIRQHLASSEGDQPESNLRIAR